MSASTEPFHPPWLKNFFNFSPQREWLPQPPADPPRPPGPRPARRSAPPVAPLPPVRALRTVGMRCRWTSWPTGMTRVRFRGKGRAGRVPIKLQLGRNGARWSCCDSFCLACRAPYSLTLDLRATGKFRRLHKRVLSRPSLSTAPLPLLLLPAGPTTPLLDTVNFPVHIKNFSMKQVKQLAKELRGDIINTVSKTGGHLGENACYSPFFPLEWRPSSCSLPS